MDKNQAYAEARMSLDTAMDNFIKAAQDVGFGDYRIVEDVCDSLFDQSGKKIITIPEP